MWRETCGWVLTFLTSMRYLRSKHMIRQSITTKSGESYPCANFNNIISGACQKQKSQSSDFTIHDNNMNIIGIRSAMALLGFQSCKHCYLLTL